MVCYPWFCRTYHWDDELNHKRLRNIKNTSKGDYNCGGYALGTFSWYQPVFEDSDFEFGFDCEEEAVAKTSECVYVMLREFRLRNIREIASIGELRKNEYAFAFRLSSDGDFHYIKRYSNGHWYHKRGNSPIIKQISSYEVFHSVWCDRYDGPIVLMAVKE